MSLSPNRSDLSLNSIKISVVVDETSTMKVERDKSVILCCDKAKKVLGWTPRHKPLLEDVGVFFRAWKAKYLATLDP